MPPSSPSPSRTSRAAPPAARIAAAAALACAALGGLVRIAAPGSEPLWQALLGLAVAVPMAIAVGRGLATGRERTGWIGIVAGLVLTGLAAELGGMPSGHGVPAAEVGLADLAWLARYPLLYGGLGLLLFSRTPALGIRHVLDGLIGALAAAALFELLLGPRMLAGAIAPDAVVDLRSLNPLVDVLVLGFLGGAAVLNGWPKRAWLPLVLDILLLAVGELLDNRSAFTAPGEPLGWSTYPIYLLAAWFLTAAAFGLQRGPRRIATPRRPVLPALVLAGVAIATLVAASTTRAAGAAVALAAAALVVSLARQWLTLRDNDRLLDLTRAEAATDALTGLGNRRSLTADLADAAQAATPDRPLTLALYDLDGFKHYNDTFGHPAGDSLLQRLGMELSATARPAGRAYRMGGDEFCLLITGTFDHAVLVAAGRRALGEHGEGFSIGASCGVATLPGDVRTPMDVLRLADQRMYAEKGSGKARRPTPDLSATAALLQIVRERDPSLDEHTAEVAAWAAGVAEALGADPETVEQARLGGELHDIGKTAIPDAILHKPGALSAQEWEFMKRHTVIGERILLADAALEPIAAVARSHHERWEGGGYPDDVCGEQIPLVARIVAVCDAFEAMVSDRPYRRGRPPAEAVEELLRCRGGQFDPAVVDAFVALIAGELAGARAAAC
jgi:diguanylate cyclase (GGDEF)-like protein/putative nucleotidyltransferase with HDIG domain